MTATKFAVLSQSQNVRNTSSSVKVLTVNKQLLVYCVFQVRNKN